MNRGLLHLLLCLALAFTGTPAWAHCRPENRVGGSPVFSSNFASQENAKPIAASGENAACGYDFASGLHKYLYCQGNPVNGWDPSGHEELADVEAASLEGEAIDAAPLPALYRAYYLAYGAVSKMAMNQQQIINVVNAAAATLTAALVGLDVTARVANRLLQNTATIPAGNFSYGKSLEQTALQSEQGYLGGTVSKIDYFDKNSGLAISFKSHGLSSSMPNLSDRLLVAIQRDLQKVSDVKVSGARGLPENGPYVDIAGSQIKQVVLTVAVPESQAATVMSSTFQRALAAYEEFYETEIEVIPVRGWLR